MFPRKIYFQTCRINGKALVCEADYDTCHSLTEAAKSVDDHTLEFFLMDDGVFTDASEDVAREWWRLYGEEVEFDGNDEPMVSEFIRNLCSEQIDELYGELETQRADHFQAQRDYYRGLGV